ncbi:MAG: isopeptide-forming domain-containing fimbrial protein [Clostridiales bacterium]|nr:isopeptide-forming domain-containing fimbrial protein [Clostridiales bacterium]
MSKLKKFASMILALVLALGLTTTAFAADMVTVENLSGHTFTAYQIFSGTQSTDTGTALGDAEWGSGIESTNFLAALKASTVLVDTDNSTTLGSLFTTCTTAKNVADVLDAYTDNSTVAKAFAALAVNYVKGEGTVIAEGTSSLAAGYYLIVDTTTSLADGDAYNAALLQVTGGGTITIAEKTDAPTVDKSVDDADTYIGGTVTFTLTGSVPDMTYYDAYKYVFHDTLSPSLKYTEDTLKVYGVDASNNKTDITTAFTVDTGTYDATNGTTITVSISNLKSLSDVSSYENIVVEYNAVLQSSATVGQTYNNKNTVYLEYSNNPDNSGSGSNATTGNTPTDVVYVFTYELDGTKVDADSYDSASSSYTTTLADAEFNLTKTENSTTYYVQLDSNYKITGWTATKADATTIKSGTDGTFKVIGLDAGTYSLNETKAPAGYNLLENPIAIVITAGLTSTETGTASDDLDTISTLTITVNDADPVDGTTSTGVVTITVENNAGATLPTTGGIGTTIFYIVGSVLVLGAVVLLITRKRMNKAE